ncbi:hypothetical protein [uncultured Lacinutrix sp.]|uniref:hypothetical protein n=1 Tax=uncultured Lacinutrix sp. TaxID=574032 RepID=UPI00260996D6|nr:hypothetical protein [uncultured Lacinutrix sp.]
MKDITMFRGIMNGIDITILNNELVEALLKANVIQLLIEDFDYDFENKVFGRSIYFNRKEYKFNDIIFEDIYNILKREVEVLEYPIMEKNNNLSVEWGVENEIEIEKHYLNAHFENDKKIKYCLKKRKKNLLKVKDHFSYKEYTGGHLNKNYNWKNTVKNNIIFSPKTINKYLNEEYVFDDGLDYFVDDSENMFSVKNDILKLWYSFFVIVNLDRFYEDQIRKLQQNVPEKQTSKARKPLTIREKVLLIQAIRDIKSDIWENLKPTDKEKLFNPLINASERNIRDYISEIDKKPSEKSEVAIKSQDKINQLLSNLGI